MVKKLKNLLNISKLFKGILPTSKRDIPSEIVDSEKIVRAVYSPVNLDKKRRRLNNNFYKPPNDSDEVSVNRLDYTTFHFLKELALRFENTESRRNYFGFAELNASTIRSVDFDVVYSPIIKPVENLFHSDIKTEYLVERGVPIPAEIKSKMLKLSKKAILIEDGNPSEMNWKPKKS